MIHQNIKFQNPEGSAFFQTLRKRVDDYFRETGLSRTANSQMVLKTIFMFTLYLTPYALMMSNLFNPWMSLLFYFIMGIGVAGIGLSVMHDANHGAYSSNTTVNRFMSYTMDVIGGSSFNWRIQHNVLHHTYTNIVGMDEDLSSGRVIRFSFQSEHKPHHKYQHIYGGFLYGLLTFVWAAYSDYTRLARYVKLGLVARVKANPTERFVKLVFVKMFYLTYALVLPIVLTDITWYQGLIGFFIAHYTAGMILSWIFQLAHVMEDNKMPIPDANGVIAQDWAIHQMETTANFGNSNKLLTWYAGGLNHQIEHHLFPGICHVHYPALSKIVKQTAQEYGVPYHAYDTFFGAAKAHIEFLRQLGQQKPAAA